MKKHSLALLLAVMTLALMSFRTAGTVTGTYGVSAADPSQIALTLNDDHSFSYQDLSDPKAAIRVSGTWNEKNGKVELTSSIATSTYHHTWQISGDGRVAKSKKGMTFYTLMRK